MSSKELIRALLITVLGLAIVGPAALGQDAVIRKVKSRVDPEYPELARRIHLTGTVKIQVTINPAGTVKSTKVIGGNPVLVQSAVDAIKKWKFEAANEETTQVVPVNYGN